MENQLLLVNLDFGTKQLGGNAELFIRLLGRFEDEYQDAEGKLAEFTQHDNLEAMQLLVHTIKGVSGNLGLEQLAVSAKHAEDQVKAGSIDPNLIAVLVDTLNQTLVEIKRVRSGHTGDSRASTPSIQPTGKHLDQLISALQQQRFISDEMLDNAIHESQLSDADVAQLQAAILDLDHTRALALLGGS